MASGQGQLVVVGRRAIALVVLCVALALPASASAGTVSLSGGRMSFLADDGVANTITVTGTSGQITVRDAGHDILLTPFTDANSKCSHPTSDSATCPATSVEVSAGDLDDTIDATGANIAGDPTIGSVFLNGEDGNDTILGGPSTDTLSGDNGNDNLHGAGGGDFLTGGDGNDSLSGGPGDDSFEVVAFATMGNDTIDGGDGNDTLVQPERGFSAVGDGADTFNGGPGIDTADYSSSTSNVNVSLDSRSNDGYANEADDIGADVEVVKGGSADDTLTGSDAANELDGGGGVDHLDGMGGPDVVHGDDGSDVLAGGDGADALVGGEGDDGLQGGAGNDTEDGSGGTDHVVGEDGSDILAGGAGGDTLQGGNGDDTIRGADAASATADVADMISGGAGADHIDGEGGNDRLDGGGGPDTLAGGAGDDTVEYQHAAVPVQVTIDNQADDGATGEHDNVMPDVEDVAAGNHGSTVVGTDAPNTLAGGTGEDYEDGGSGSDTLGGGNGGDVLRSRDGQPDRVDCGGGPDFVIADPGDVTRHGCEHVDVGRGKPRYRSRILAEPSGSNLLKLPWIHRFVPLGHGDHVGLPLGVTIDPLQSSMTIVAASPAGHRQVGTFSGNRFLVKQPLGQRLTEVDLTGSLDLSKCGGKGASAARSHMVRRRLFANAHGHFRMRGRYSSATVRGTRWGMEDRCDGTLTTVLRGSVVVRDFGRGRNIVVRAGHSYLARRGNR
jgi:Ca2+-binding RTX toxin-like protein